MASILKISSTNPTTQNLLDLHLILKKNDLINAYKEDDEYYIEYKFPANGYAASITKPISIGDYATLHNRDLKLYLRYTADIAQMPIWNFLKNLNSPILKYLEDVGSVFDVQMISTSVLSRYSNTLSPRELSDFLKIREHFNEAPNHDVAKQVLMLASIMKLFFDDCDDSDDITHYLNSIIFLIKHLKKIDSLDEILQNVNMDKSVPDKSPCLKRYRSKINSYFIFRCGFPILKTYNFKVFAKMPELQILHLAVTHELNNLT